MAHGDFKDLTRKTASDKILLDKAFKIVKNPKSDGYQCGLASMVYNFFYKKTSPMYASNLLEVVLKMKVSLRRINWRITQTNFFCYLLLIFSVKTRRLDESDCKPNKIWVDKSSGFYNRSMKSKLEKNDIEMCSIHNEGKSVVAERFIRILKNKIYEYMT